MTTAALVLLHGLGGSSFDWAHVDEVLDGRGVVPDLLGHGGRRWDGEVTFTALADDVFDQLDRRSVDRFFVAGTSMGAATALTMASRRPDRVTGMLLVAPSWLDTAEPVNLRRLQKVGRLIAEQGADRAAAILRGLPPVAGWDRDQVREWEGRLGAAHPPSIARALVELPRALPMIDVAALSGVPTAVLTWTNDPIHPVPLAERLAEILGAPLRVVDRPVRRSDEAAALARSIRDLIDVVRAPVGPSAAPPEGVLAVRCASTRPLTVDAGRADGPAFEQIPVSFPQQLLRFLDLLRPGTVRSSTFNVMSTHRLRGPIDLDALRAAADELVVRHEMLRTSVRWSDGVPYQEIAPPMPCRWSVESLDGAASAAEAASDFSDRIRETAFDVAVPPLVRIAVGQRAADDHLLAICGHHTAMDAWSLELLVGDLGALYAQRAHGGRGLDESPCQYREFAIAEQRSGDGPEVRAALDFWTDHLDGVQPTSFPPDHRRAERNAGGKHLLTFTIEPELVAAMKVLARAERMTPFMVFLAAYCVALAEESGAPDVVVPVITAGRDDHWTHSSVGFFVNAFLFRVAVDADDPAGALAAVGRRSFDVYAHPSVSIVRVLEASTDAALMFGDEDFVLFPFQVVQPAPVVGGPDFGPDVQCQVLVPESDGAMGGLAQPLDGLFTVAGTDDGGMTGLVLYEPTLFDRSSIDRIGQRYVDALRRLVAVRRP